jgi:hypothetical protein
MPTLESVISSRVILTFIGLILLAYQGFEADSGVTFVLLDGPRVS